MQKYPIVAIAIAAFTLASPAAAETIRRGIAPPKLSQIRHDLVGKSFVWQHIEPQDAALPGRPPGERRWTIIDTDIAKLGLLSSQNLTKSSNESHVKIKLSRGNEAIYGELIIKYTLHGSRWNFSRIYAGRQRAGSWKMAISNGISRDFFDGDFDNPIEFDRTLR